jgi:hypothetical protein
VYRFTVFAAILNALIEGKKKEKRDIYFGLPSFFVYFTLLHDSFHVFFTASMSHEAIFYSWKFSYLAGLSQHQHARPHRKLGGGHD